ncbi:MAG: DUF4340 domain-containing protein [Candidatus Muiribacteriota bacterium]
MNKINIIILLMVIISGILTYLTVFETGESFLIERVQKGFIDEIIIRSEGEVYNLKKKNNNFFYNGEKIQTHQIDKFFIKLNSIVILREMGNITEMRSFGLDEPRLELEVKKGGQSVHEIKIGNRNPANTGFYIIYNKKLFLITADFYNEVINLRRSLDDQS